MKRTSRVRVFVAVAFLALAGYLFLESPGHPPLKEAAERIQTGACSIPATILQTGDRKPAYSIIIFHGLTANKAIMRSLGRSLTGEDTRTYLVDLPGHGNNTEPFSFERAETCAAELVDTLEKRGEIRLDRTVLVGHSMGAGIAIRLADLYPTAATISISSAMRKVSDGKPAEYLDLELPRRMPVNLLLVNAQFDLPTTKEASLRILRAAEGQRYSPRDFEERRAVQWVTVPFATHTSLIVDPRVLRIANRWTHAALPQESRDAREPNSLFYAGLSGLAGLLLLFPNGASIVHSAFGKPAAKGDFQSPRTGKALLYWLMAALAGVCLQYAWVPLAPVVRLYSGAYLASALMIAGVILLHFREKLRQPFPGLNWSFGSTVFAATLGLTTILAFGAWMNLTLTDVWMNAPRWWRFAVLIPILLPYLLAEEIALGAPAAEGKTAARAGRMLWFLGLRTILWLTLAFALQVLKSGEILIVLLVIYMAAFSIVQRMGSDAVRRRTGSAAAAAVFGAILGAWFIAAVFPLT